MIFFTVIGDLVILIFRFFTFKKISVNLATNGLNEQGEFKFFFFYISLLLSYDEGE